MTLATVKRVSERRDYLFATVNGRAVFVHVRAFPSGSNEIEGLEPGDEIFVDDVHDTPRGPRAEKAELR